MVTLKNDRYYMYVGRTEFIDVLENDTLPSTYTLTSDRSWAKVVGDEIEVAFNPSVSTTPQRFTYTVTDTATGESDRATVTIVPLAGEAGVGGFDINTYGRFSEDDGILRIDLGELLNPDAPRATKISDLTVSSYSLGFNGGVMLETSLNNSVFEIDLAQLGALDEGENARVWVRFDTEFGGKTAENELDFVVNGADDVVTTISSGVGANLTGDRGNNVLVSRPDVLDKMLGGHGGDVFKFNRDYYDGNRDRDVILDYQVNSDRIEFSEGTEAQYLFEVDGGVMMTFDDGRDNLIVFGEGLTLENIDATGYVDPPTPDRSDFDSGGVSTGDLQAFIFQQQMLSYTIDWTFGFSPLSPTPFIFDPIF